jgi:C2 domain
MIPPDADPDCIDTFVRVYLVPDEADAMQTKIFRNSSNPSYQESFLFFIAKQNLKRSLWFHLYHTNAHCTTLIGKLIGIDFFFNWAPLFVCLALVNLVKYAYANVKKINENI